jgi:hypothetical protein
MLTFAPTTEWMIASSLPLRIDQMSLGDAEDGAVSQQLVEIGLGEAAGLLGLVLGVDHEDNSVRRAPQEVQAREAHAAWEKTRDEFATRFPKLGPLMDEAKAEVLAFTTSPRAHWRKIWFTNPLERVNKEIKRRSRVVGIFPNSAAVSSDSSEQS